MKTTSDDLMQRLHGLHKQATVERSHYYVGSCVKDAMHRIDDLEDKLARAVEALQSMPEAVVHTTLDDGPLWSEDRTGVWLAATGAITVKDITVNEDGSATYKFHMDAHTRGLLAEEGLKLVLYCAAAKLDMGVVYDFIEDHIRYENDNPEK